MLIHFVLLGLLAMTAGGNSTPPEPPAELPAPAPAASASAAEGGGGAEGDNGGAEGTPPPTRVVTPAAPRQSSAATSTSTVSQDEVVTYVVKQGDNLTKIARACGATVPELAELNGKPIKRLEKLWVGQKIKLPRPISE